MLIGIVRPRQRQQAARQRIALQHQRVIAHHLRLVWEVDGGGSSRLLRNALALLYLSLASQYRTMPGPFVKRIAESVSDGVEDREAEEALHGS